MRAKTSDFLKVLNRARPEPKNVEKKTITLVYIITSIKNLGFTSLIMFFWLHCHADWLSEADVLEKHVLSIFRAEVIGEDGDSMLL
jgi:hypothetical protein